MNPYLYPGIHTEGFIPALEEIKTFKKLVNNDLDEMRKKLLSETRYETLKECIERVFKCDLSDKSRRTSTALGKHLWRYILMSIDKNCVMRDAQRLKGGHQIIEYRFSIMDVSLITGCEFENVRKSVKTASNLIKTNRSFREKAEMVFDKINHRIVIFPI